jgi:hypothetical protein
MQTPKSRRIDVTDYKKNSCWFPIGLMATEEQSVPLTVTGGAENGGFLPVDYTYKQKG